MLAPSAKRIIKVLLLASATLLLASCALFVDDRSPEEKANHTLFDGISAHSKRKVQKAIKLGVDVNEHNLRTFSRSSALTSAVYEDYMPVIELLVKHGADPNDGHMFSSAAFVVAILQKNYPVMELFIGNGAELNKRYGFGGSAPLNFAAETGDLQLVKFLLENGAVINHKGTYKDHGFHFRKGLLLSATESGNAELYQFLEERGAN